MSTNTDEGFFDWAAGSIDESIARQTDDETGGGFLDETEDVLDPDQQASEQTEEDLRDSPAGGSLAVLDVISFASGDTGDVNEVESAQEAGEGAAQFASDSVDAALNIGPDWLDEATAAALIILIIGALLWLGMPYAELGAAVAED